MNIIKKNGLEVIHDVKIVDSAIQTLKDNFNLYEENLVGSGEVFQVEYEMFKYFEEKVMARHISNQTPLIFSTGFWCNESDKTILSQQ